MRYPRPVECDFFPAGSGVASASRAPEAGAGGLATMSEDRDGACSLDTVSGVGASTADTIVVLGGEARISSPRSTVSAPFASTAMRSASVVNEMWSRGATTGSKAIPLPAATPSMRALVP